MLVSLTVGKVDAGVAVLLTEDKRLIEFPSILLPPYISSGSIVDITVSRNLQSENVAHRSFLELQDSVHDAYGHAAPSTPVLRCRNATQTSVVLEWDPIELATAELRSLSLFRNGNKAGNIPRPLETRTTKLSGLALDQEYSFQLVLKTSAGTYNSEKLTVKTHKMTDLSGITVTPGVLPSQLRSSLQTAVERIGAKFVESVRIDTTHFVCTEGRGREWERAVEMNIPVVRPEWVEGCEREGRVVSVRGYYLNADPRLRQVGQGVGVQGQAQAPQNRRTDSQVNVGKQPASQRASNAGLDSAQQTPKTGVTESSIVSPGTNPNGDTAPPTPPRKDSKETRPAAREKPRSQSPLRDTRSPAIEVSPAPTPSQEQVSDLSEDDDHKEPRRQPAGKGRELVSPLSTSDGMEVRMAGMRLQQDARGPERTISDGGSFSEVQL